MNGYKYLMEDMKKMINEKVEITYGISLILYQVCQTMLKNNGKENKLPFRLKFRLKRNIIPLERDMQYFEHQKLLLLAKYGEANEEGTKVSIVDEENKKKYFEEIKNLLNQKVSHTLVKLEEDDIDQIKEVLDISFEDISLIISYMTNCVDDLKNKEIDLVEFNDEEIQE